MSNNGHIWDGKPDNPSADGLILEGWQKLTDVAGNTPRARQHRANAPHEPLTIVHPRVLSKEGI